MTTTILTVGPLGDGLFPGGTMKHNFGGAGLPATASDGLTTRTWLGLASGTQVYRVRYPAAPTPRSISDGVVALDRKLRATEGDVLVFAHSQGAQVVSRWLRKMISKPGAPSPSRVEFLLIGNPLRKYGGFGVGRKEFDGLNGLATPNNTAYTVRDVKLQYDGWADKPTKPGFWAMINSAQDRGGINFGRAIHAMGYRTADLDDAQATSYTENLTEYIMIPHPPLIGPQNRIERSYQRPER